MNNEMMISGKWFNKNTGEVVNVVNNVIDGDNMVIVTDKGTINLTDFGEYIQMSDEIYDENGKLIGSEQVNYNDLAAPKPQISIKQTKQSKQQYSAPVPDPVQEKLHDKEFVDSIYMPELEAEIITEKQQALPVSNNEHIISKFFDKLKDKEKLIHIDLDTSILPINDLKTITNYMDVSTDEIAKYITEKLIDKSYINEIIVKALKDILEKAD